MKIWVRLRLPKAHPLKKILPNKKKVNYKTIFKAEASKEVPNLMYAGRLASFSYVVFGSIRVMKTCAAMGQATGTAAAYAALNKK